MGQRVRLVAEMFLPMKAEFTLDLPAGSSILSVVVHDRKPVLLYTPGTEKDESPDRYKFLWTTGSGTVDWTYWSADAVYLGTVSLGMLQHLFLVQYNDPFGSDNGPVDEDESEVIEDVAV